MIQIVPVECNDTISTHKNDFFCNNDNFFAMEMQDGPLTMGRGSLYIKGEVAYLLALDIYDLSNAYMIFDSLLRSMMNLASHRGALVFNSNELNPLMGYFKKNEFDEITNFSMLSSGEPFKYYVVIELFFARPCRG